MEFKPIIAVKELRFEYPGVLALDDVSFELQSGEITGLVGPNGAGKTTLLRCLAALEQPIRGYIELDGVDVLNQPRECHRKIGYLSDFYGLYKDLSVQQCLKYMAYAHGLRASQLLPAVETAAKRLNIQDRLDSKAGTLSRGLSQRLAIAQAIIHQPKILLLDEPASGLDPEARQELSSLFMELKEQGMTLIVSSHILAELDEYCSNMLMVRSGKVVEHSLITANDGFTLMQLETLKSESRLLDILNDRDDIKDIKADGNKLRFNFDGDENQQHQLLKTLLANNISIFKFGNIRLNMQETYLDKIK